MLTFRATVAIIVIVAPCTAFGAAGDVVVAGDQAPVTSTRVHPAREYGVGPIDAAGRRAATGLVTMAALESPVATTAMASTSPRRGWIARHPVLFGALAGAAVGTAVAAGAWGNEGAFVGLYGGAAAGAVVGALLR